MVIDDWGASYWPYIVAYSKKPFEWNYSGPDEGGKVGANITKYRITLVINLWLVVLDFVWLREVAPPRRG